jgi:hypothetical protein
MIGRKAPDENNETMNVQLISSREGGDPLKTKRDPVIRTTLCVAVLAVTIGCAEKQAVTRPEPAAAQKPTSQAAAEPAEAKHNVTDVKGVTYYQCGSTWYTQAYGNSGVIYMPVPPPSKY